MSSSRKDDHVRLAMEQETAHRRSRDFDDVRVLHHALSAVNVETVNLEVEIGERTWPLPFYINGMTGGSEFTGKINQALAIAAADTGIAMASGSMSAYFKDPAFVTRTHTASSWRTFQRTRAPSRPARRSSLSTPMHFKSM